MRNLRVEEIFIGMWVFDVASGTPCTIAKVCKENVEILCREERREIPLADVLPLEIDDRVLIHFGFQEDTGRNVWIKKIGNIRLIVGLKQVYGHVQCRRVSFGGGLVSGWNEEIRYVHEMQRWWVDKVLMPFGVALELEWAEPKEKEF